jgi:diaminopimelate decarboxylase
MLPGAPWIAHHDGSLWVEQVPLQRLAEAHGTPLYV